MFGEAGRKEKPFPRRTFLASFFGLPLLDEFPRTIRRLTNAPSSRASDAITLLSPRKNVTFELLFRDRQLSYEVKFNGTNAIERSVLAIIVDGVNLSSGVETHTISRYSLDEKFLCRGNHSVAFNRAKAVKVSLTHKPSNTSYQLELRAYDDGIAFRHILSDDARPRVPDEAASFVLPDGSSVWYHDFEGHYEGVHSRKEISQVQAGEW